MFSLALVAVVVGAVAISRLWKRFVQLETAVAALTARLQELERPHVEQPVRTQPASRPASTPVARPPSAEPAVVAPPRPVPPPRPVTLPMPPPPRSPIPVMPTAPSLAAERPSSGTRHAETRDAIETRIGTRWLLYIGIAAIVIGVAYF